MKIVFNTLSTLRPKTGVGHYAAQLSAAIERQLGPGELTSFPGPSLSSWLKTGRGKGNSPYQRVSRLRSQLSNVAKTVGRSALESMFRWQCRPGQFDLYHEPNFLPMRSSIPTIVTVHDLSVLLHPEWHPADRVHRHESLFRRAVAKASHVITVSENVRRDVMQHLNVPPDHVTAIHNGIGPEFFTVSAEQTQAARKCWNLPANYLLFCGTIEPRKNLETLMRSYCDLPSQLRDACPLIVAGGWGWKSEAVAEFYETTAKHRGVRIVGYVDDTHRPGLFAGARALLFPSHFEGFGLPPVEMLAAGGAVIASDIAVHHEILGRHAEFVSPMDRDGWTSAISKAITDDKWLTNLRIGGQEYARRFDWNRAAQQTITIYRQGRDLFGELGPPSPGCRLLRAA